MSAAILRHDAPSPPEGAWLHDLPAPGREESRAAARRLGRADELVAGILDVVAARTFALDALLRLCAMEWSDEIATACVDCADRPRMLLNAAFVERWCGTRERLAMLVLHELAHVSMGHSRLYPRPTLAHNVALDAVVNREVLGALSSANADVPRFAALLESAYAPHVAPWFLLRPPPGWPRTPDWTVSDGCPPALREIHQRLYGGRGAPQRDARHTVLYGEIVEALRQRAPAGGNSAGDAGAGAAVAAETGDAGDGARRTLAALLGAHGATAREATATSGGRDAIAAELLGDTVRALGGHVAGTGGDPFRHQIEGAARRAALERALRALLLRVFTGVGASRALPVLVERPTRSVDPAADRRAITRVALARTLGAPRPVLFHGYVSERRPAPREALVYLDVSGSMYGVLPALRAALAPLARQLRPRVHVFSTDVHRIGAAELDRGTVPTTGGTSVSPVLEHLLVASRCGSGPARAESALVLTDGYFDAPPQGLVRQVRQAGLRIHLAVAGTGPLHEGAAWVASATRLPTL